MRRLYSIVAIALLALWLPASLHCELEWAGMSADSSSHEKSSDADSARDCDADACAILEKGGYRFGGDVLFTIPPVTGWLLALASISPGPEAPLTRAFDVTASPPEVSRTWRFVMRAASPPRAPALRG